MQHKPLPACVVKIAEYLALKAQGYNNRLKWNERAEFKADLMNAGSRWIGVDPALFAATLRTRGMREEDVSALVDWLRKAQAGRRLVLQRSYRSYVFNPLPSVDDTDTSADCRSIVW